MFLHQGTIVLINSIDITNVTHLKTISNVWIPAHSFVAIPTKRTGKCIPNTPFILGVEIDEIIGVQTPSWSCCQLYRWK